MANQTIQYLATQAYPNVTINFLDDLMKESGILRTATAGFASHGLFHKYNKVTGLPTASIRSINGSVVPTTSTYDLMQLDLKEIMTIEQVDSSLAKADPNGAEGYMRKVAPSHMESIAQAAEKSIIYGTNSTFGATDGFVGMHETAKANSKVIQNSGASSASTSIFAVNWKPEVTQLVIPNFATQGDQFVVMTVLHNGEPTLAVVNTSTGAKKPVYEVMYQLMMAAQWGTTYSVASLTQIDATHLPTVDKVDKLIDYVKGGSANTVLYMSRDGRRYLQSLKATKFFSQVDNAMNTILEFWNGIPIVVSDNISNVETSAID